MVKSLDDNVIATVACVTNGAANPTGNKYDPVYWYGSTDAGATWEGKFYGFGYTTTGTSHVVYGQISNRDYAPYFCNFEQVSMIIDQTGVSHLLANGYGEGLYMGGTDTVNTYPMLYSNSNMLSGDTNKIGWMDPDTSSSSLRKIKPFCEIYESEIVFYAFTNDIPFQSEPCPHMNEGIRTVIREFLNSLEKQHSGIKNNLYQSILRVSSIVKETNYKEKTVCKKCGNDCTGDVCSVCSIVLKLKENQT